MKIEIGTIVRWKTLQLSDKDLGILFSKIKAGHQISKIQVTFQNVRCRIAIFDSNIIFTTHGAY